MICLLKEKKKNPLISQLKKPCYILNKNKINKIKVGNESDMQ